MTIATESNDVTPYDDMGDSDQEFYWGMTERNRGLISLEEQEIISETIICQAGVGGNADVLLTLAQMGFQRFRIADPDTYDVSNLNRQLGGTIDTIGKKKVDIVAAELRRMNPNMTVEVFPQGVTEENVEEFLEGAHIVIDGMDNLVIKKILFDVARSNGQPVFSSPVIGWTACLAVFDPISSPTFTEFFGELPATPEEHERFGVRFGSMFMAGSPMELDMTEFRKRVQEGRTPSVAATCRLNAALVCSAIYGWLFEKGRIPVVPMTLQFDLLGARVAKAGPIKHWVISRAVEWKSRRTN
jgi:molybdopterin/thiamine biosynthesis adenylyltransferase